MDISNGDTSSSKHSTSRPIDEELCRLHQSVIIAEEDDETDSALNGFNVTSCCSNRPGVSGSWTTSMNSIDSNISSRTAMSNLSPISTSTLPTNNHYYLHHQNSQHHVNPYPILGSQQPLSSHSSSPGTWNINRSNSGHSLSQCLVYNNIAHHTFPPPHTTHSAPADPRFNNYALGPITRFSY